MKLTYVNQFFDLSSDMFCVATMDGYFLELNPAWEKTLGWKIEELLSKPFYHFIHEVDREKTHKIVDDVAAGKTIFQFRNRYLHKDGSWKILSWRGSVDQESRLLFGVARDITAIVETSKLASLGEMAADIAHEINNPLAIIHGKACQLREKLSSDNLESESLAEGLRTIEKTTMRIASIIRGLRAFSRSGEGDPFEEVLLVDILEDTLPLCWDRLKERGIEFRLKAAPNLKVFCRPSQISQVVVNLMNNAADALETVPEKWIELDCSASGESVSLKLTDSGKGIPDDIAARMMDPFFTTKGVGKGTGLGLSIVKGIVEEHQGTVFYNRESPHTQFVVQLPLEHTS